MIDKIIKIVKADDFLDNIQIIFLVSTLIILLGAISIMLLIMIISEWKVFLILLGICLTPIILVTVGYIIWELIFNDEL